MARLDWTAWTTAYLRPRRLLRFLHDKHAIKHFHETGHPIVTSFESGGDWRYCYVDDILV